jgi:hypothetical protein
MVEIDAEKESDSEYDGFLSYSSEWHALSIGYAIGFASVMPVPGLKRFVFRLVFGTGEVSRTQAIKEAKKESWYALGGIPLGAILGIISQVIIVASAWFIAI